MALTVFATTWNTGLQGSKAQAQDLSSWLLPVLHAQDRDVMPDIYAIAVQELLPVHLALAGLAQPVLIALTTRIQSLLSSHATSIRPDRAPESYALVSRVAQGGTALWVFARDATLGAGAGGASRLGRALEARLGLWYGGMGNKAAVGVRVPVKRQEGGWEVLTFINTHLEAHDHNIPRRNAQYNNILSSLLFRPSDPLAQTFAPRDTSHLFVMGDLNYRLERLPPAVQARGEPREGGIRGRGNSEEEEEDDAEMDLIKEREELFALDTLRREQRAGKVFWGLEEGDVRAFAPTYKRVAGQVGGYSRKRIPGWTDRILVQSHPLAPTPRILAYTSTPSLVLSDHKPVHALILLPPPTYPPAPSSGLAPLLAPPPAPHVAPPPISVEVLVVWKLLGWALDRAVGWPWTVLVLLGFGNARAGMGVGAFVGLIWGIWWTGLVGGHWAA